MGGRHRQHAVPPLACLPSAPSTRDTRHSSGRLVGLGRDPPQRMLCPNPGLQVSQLWKEVVTRVAADYPEVELSHMYIGGWGAAACCACP